jgi:hypothetical protein
MTATLTTTRLRIAPRAADLSLVADPTLERLYDIDWTGAEPSIREDDGAVDIRYTLRGRLQALAPHGASLALRLTPAAIWTIELDRGVSGLRADLRDLQVAAVVIRGGASDVELDLPTPRGELAVRIEGGVSTATVRHPEGVPVDLAIDGGASRLRFDEHAIGSAGGELRFPGAPGADRVALQILGGASHLTIGT